MSVEQDKDVKAIMANAQKEEFKHFGMNLEFLLRKKDDWRKELQGILFNEGDIVELGEKAEKSVDLRCALGMEENMKLQRIGITGAACLLASTLGMRIPAEATASSAAENPWAAEHIEKLPPDIRREISRRERVCGSGALAGHYFAVSVEAQGQRFVSLHFEDFSCANRASVCRGEECLHEIFVETGGGRHRLVFSQYARDVTMTHDRGTVGLDVSQRQAHEKLRWTGRVFAPVSTRNGTAR